MESTSIDLIDLKETCRVFGGSKPISAATLYRGIARKLYPAPVKIGGGSRWIRSECETALRQIIENQRRPSETAA